MNLPPNLLAAIADPAGAHVVLVLGAGCSVEPPTSLPLAGDLAKEAHRRLIADGLLETGDCTSPDDLSCVADTVYKRSGHQRDLVDRLPIDHMRQAEPNQGYLIAAALLRERALGCVMTLNFDLALFTALTTVGAREDVSVIMGPEDYGHLGAVNIIFLHRSVMASPDDLVLRSSAMTDGWRDRWEAIVAERVLGGPLTVFVGLGGGGASVLLETTQRIRKAVPTGVQVYQVDPVSVDDNRFFEKLELPETSYLQLGWGEFMRELSERLLEEHRVELEASCASLIAVENLASEDIAGLCSRLTKEGLLAFGSLRARWLMSEEPYATRHTYSADLVADLLLAVGLIERTTGVEAIFGEDGVVEFRDSNVLRGSVVMISGRGVRGWSALEAELLSSERHWQRRFTRPRRALVAGVGDTGPAGVAPPPDVIPRRRDTILTGYTDFEMISVRDLRSDQATAKRILE